MKHPVPSPMSASMQASAASISLNAYLDGRAVLFHVDSDSPVSLCPPEWSNGLPSHVCCRYPDGFTFAAILDLQPSPPINCLILGRDWANAQSIS